MKFKRNLAVCLVALLICQVFVFTANAVATEGNPRIWICQGGTSFGATDPQNSALMNQYDAENDIVYARVIPNNHSATPYLAFWNVKCVFAGTDAWSLTVSCLMRPNVAGITPVLVSAQSKKDTAGTTSYSGEEKYTPATDANGNTIVFSEEDVGKWHTVYFRHDGLEMRYYNQYQVFPYGNTAKASAFYTADNSKTVDIAALGEFATDTEALAFDLKQRAAAPKVKLSFDAQNGTEVSTTEVVTGSLLPAKVEFPELTAPEGKIFLGWSTDKNATEGTFDVSVPTANTTYYAIYENISYDIIFKDGENETKVTTAHGSTPEAPVLTKTGYTLGWDKEIVAATEDVTYTAVWTAKEYDVIFDAGEGAFTEGEKTKTVKVTFDTAITAPVEKPTLEGNKFIGWTPEVGVLTTEGATFTAVYELDVPKNVTSSVKVSLARGAGSVPYNTADYCNFAKLYIYKDSTKAEIVGTYNLEGANTVGAETTVDIELLEGEYYAEAVKNGYLTYKTTITIDEEATGLDEIKLIPGDIKGDFNDVCGDGVIDVNDFIRVLRGFTQSSSELLRDIVDINEDGYVNVTDINFIKTNFGMTTR